MKRFFSVLAILLVLVPIFAWQETYRQSSEEVQLFYTLRRISGTSTVEPTYPITASQLLSLVKSLDTSNFKETARTQYDSLVEKLERPEALIKYDDIGVDAEMQIVPFQWWSFDADPLYYPYKDRPNIFELKTKFNASEYAAGLINVNLTVSDKYSKPYKNIFNLVQSWLGKTKDGDGKSPQLFLHIPDQAYGSVGFKDINLTAGRDCLSAGNSFTGNLEVNENFIYTDYIKASFVRDKFSYDMTYMDFNDAPLQETTLSNPRKQIVNHRMSASFFNHITATLSEGAMVYTGNIFTTPMVFNPFMLIHDWYSFGSGNTNNYFTFELGGNYKGFELSFQYLFDQINNRFEDKSNGKNANALLGNISYSTELGDGLFTTYFETAYTSSLCYLKETVPEYNATEWANKNELLDLYLQLSGIWGDPINLSSMGYPYGTDVMAFGLGADYLYKGFDFSADLYLLSKGPKGAGTHEQRAADKQAEEQYNNRTNLFRMKFGATGPICKSLDFSSNIGFSIIKNHEHNKGVNVEDFEFTVAFTVDPLVFINRQKLN